MPAPDYASEITTLEGMLAKGVLEVQSFGEKVSYKSTSDLLAALNYFRAQRDANKTAKSQTTVVQFCQE